MTKQFINFTVANLEKLPSPAKGIAIYKDEKSPDLSLYVTVNGAKSFFVRKRILGKDQRLVLGRFPVMTIDQARRQALSVCGIIAERKDPRAEQRKIEQVHLTFGSHFTQYLERYSMQHKKTWKEDKRDIEKYLSSWFSRRLSDISKEEIQRLHEAIGQKNGRYQANRILQRVRAIYNKAIEWGWQGNNPTIGIKKFKEQSRERFIRPHEMPFVMMAIENSDEAYKDFFKLLLLTGTRKTNMLMMRWNDILWHAQEWHIPVTKNGDPLVVPLVEDAFNILQMRYKQSKSEWVFPSKHDERKHLCSPRQSWLVILASATLAMWSENEKVAPWLKQNEARFQECSNCEKLEKIILLAKKEKVITPPVLTDLRIHDIRRTFGSYQAITGASLTIIGKSLGHKCSQATQVYARLHLDPVRASVEKATAAMFGKA